MPLFERCIISLYFYKIKPTFIQNVTNLTGDWVLPKLMEATCLETKSSMTALIFIYKFYVFVR